MIVISIFLFALLFFSVFSNLRASSIYTVELYDIYLIDDKAEHTHMKELFKDEKNYKSALNFNMLSNFHTFKCVCAQPLKCVLDPCQRVIDFSSLERQIYKVYINIVTIHKFVEWYDEAEYPLISTLTVVDKPVFINTTFDVNTDISPLLRYHQELEQSGQKLKFITLFGDEQIEEGCRCHLTYTSIHRDNAFSRV